MSATASPPSTDALNQPPPLPDYNAFEATPSLREALQREGAGWAEERLHALGAHRRQRRGDRGSGRQANENPPVLRTHDRYGHRIDEVEFHPAWHELMDASPSSTACTRCPGASRAPGAHVARAAMFLTWHVEAGHGCPISMTYSAVPALRHRPEHRRRVGAADHRAYAYDPRAASPPPRRRGALFGMAMTEKQGGSDVRANTTRAEPLNGGGRRRVRAHRPQVVLLGADVRRLPGARAGRRAACRASCCRAAGPTAGATRFHLQRLKDKLGNRSNASSEVEFDGAWARRVGEEGRGVPTIIEMVEPHPPGLRARRRGRHARGGRAGHLAHRPPHRLRHAAGRPAADAQRARRPRARVRGGDRHRDAPGARLRRGRDGDEQAARSSASAPRSPSTGCASAPPAHAAEALECLGGNGYVEESGMPRLYREAPLNGIWEGSGNVICLDVLRALAQDARDA